MQVSASPSRVRSFQCCECAARVVNAFIRCPSCGTFRKPVPLAFKAPVRRKPENSWRAHGGDEDGGGFDRGGFGEGLDGNDDEGGDGEPFGQAPEPMQERDDAPLPVVAHELDDVAPADDQRLPSGHRIWDEVTCGGPVLGTASGLTSFPGVGKSTLMLEVGYAYRALGKRVMYLSLEEPSSKVSRRAIRLRLADKYPRKFSKKSGKALGYFRIISPLDDVEGESDDERELRLEKGYALERLLENVDPKVDVLILDSASMSHDPDVEGLRGGIRQLKNTGRIFYERCQGAGRFADARPCVGISILQSTKTGDSAVPQAFTHYIDATYLGEHVEHDGNSVVACRDQKRPTGFIAFRSHGKNRDGSVTAIAYARMTEEGLQPCDHDDVPPRGDQADEEEVEKKPKKKVAGKRRVDEELTMEGMAPRRKGRK